MRYPQVAEALLELGVSGRGLLQGLGVRLGHVEVVAETVARVGRVAVGRGVDLRAQPAARPAESVIARFVPAAARILVTRPSPSVFFAPRTILPNNTFGGGRVLMRPHDRGIDRHRPIAPASSVGLGLDHSQ